MKHFANSSANDLFKEYGMASKNHAARLRESAINLLTHGFEESIRLAPKRISYKNQPKEGYDPPPPCCRIPSKAVRCGGEGAAQPAGEGGDVVAIGVDS